MPVPVRFALNGFTTQLLSLEEDLALCRRLGISALELCEMKLSDDPRQARTQLHQVRDAGLHVVSVQPRVHAFFPDQMAEEPTDPTARADVFKRTIDHVTDALPGEPVVFVLISGRAPQHDQAHAFDTTCRLARDLATHAAARGARIAFEPLHPLLTNVDSFIWSWNEACRLVDAVAHPAFGLVCDVWHVWQEPEILARVRAELSRVFLVHVSDWREGGPRRLNDRVEPGTGLIPLEAWGRMLQAGGYDGPVCLELLSEPTLPDSFHRREPAEVVRRSLAALTSAGVVN